MVGGVGMASWKARPTRVGDNNLPRRADVLVRHSENDLVDFECFIFVK